MPEQACPFRVCGGATGINFKRISFPYAVFRDPGSLWKGQSILVMLRRTLALRRQSSRSSLSRPCCGSSARRPSARRCGSSARWRMATQPSCVSRRSSRRVQRGPRLAPRTRTLEMTLSERRTQEWLLIPQSSTRQSLLSPSGYTNILVTQKTRRIEIILAEKPS